MTESDVDDSRSVLANKDAAILLEEAFNSSILRKENFYENNNTKGKNSREKFRNFWEYYLILFLREKSLNKSTKITLFYDFIKVVKGTYLENWWTKSKQSFGPNTNGIFRKRNANILKLL